MLEKKDVKLRNTLTLAYLGDAVYETLVREYLLNNCCSLPAKLHHFTVSIVCASAQREALELIEDMLTHEEAEIVKRGRNSSKAAVPRSSTPKDYRASTALEALFGYLSLTDEHDRINEIFKVICENQIGEYIKREQPDIDSKQ